MSTSGAPGRILLVEDDDSIRNMLATLLRMQGYRVATAANGKEALAELRGGEPTQLIILDLVMPVMDGWEFRAEQRKDPALAEIPVAVLSGYRERQLAAQVAPVCHFEKPLDFNLILETVRQYCSTPA